MKNKDEILDQLYITAKDLMVLIPDIKYQRALDCINDVRTEMKEKKYFIPKTKEHIALTKLVRKKFGI